MQCLTAIGTEFRTDCSGFQLRTANKPSSRLHVTFLREGWSLNTLNKKLISRSIFAFRHLQGTYSANSKFCYWQIGCVILQKHPNEHERPIRYYSSSVTNAERANDLTYQDFLTILWALLQPCTYLEGTHFDIRADHNALKGTRNVGDATGELARCSLRLFKREVDIDFCARIKHHAVDAMLIVPTAWGGMHPIDDASPVMSINFPPKFKERERTKDVTDKCADSGTSASFRRLPAVCPVTNPMLNKPTPMGV